MSNPYFSSRMVEWHRKRLTLPPELIDQADNIWNHARFEGGEVHGAR